MLTKFSEKFALTMLVKSIENFVNVPWLIWMPHSFLKNCSDTYVFPCILHTWKQLQALPFKFIRETRKNFKNFTDFEPTENLHWLENKCKRLCQSIRKIEHFCDLR
jgi:hypothetical protein